MKGNRKSG